MAQDGHGESGERGGKRAKPDFAALVRQGHLWGHERHFPFLAAVVKFWPGRSRMANFPSNFIIIDRVLNVRFRSPALACRAIFGVADPGRSPSIESVTSRGPGGSGAGTRSARARPGR